MEGYQVIRIPVIAALVCLFLCFGTVEATAESLAKLMATAKECSGKAMASPSDYAANWRAAKACHDYAFELESQEAEGWKDLGKDAAKEGMKYGETAARVRPSGIEGWYFLGLNIGTYSDCVSILVALREGLKDKAQQALEKAYYLDKTYDNFGPCLALGRYWQSLPAIAGGNLKNAEKLFDEYFAGRGSSQNADKLAYYFRGALYKDIGRASDAKADLKKAADMGQKDAARLLAEMQ